MTDNLPEQEIQDTLMSQLPTLFVGIGITFLFTVINLGQCSPVVETRCLLATAFSIVLLLVIAISVAIPAMFGVPGFFFF
jgi:formate/nitrite transporter FocA (FNT family)